MSAQGDEKQLERQLNGIDIPPCPAILLNIQRELEKDTDQREIARLIAQDGSLAGHVMQMANSPAYGYNRIASIAQALNILGTRQIFNLLVSQLLKVSLSGGASVSMERFWETAALSARLSAELARRLRCVRPDIAYTFSFFHDCGIPLLMKRFPELPALLAEAEAREERCFTDVEDSHLGVNHAVIGYFLARRWRLLAEVVDAVRYHHDYAAFYTAGLLSSTSRMLIAVTVLAEHIIRVHAGDPVCHEWDRAAPHVCPLLGLSPEAVADLSGEMRDWLG